MAFVVCEPCQDRKYTDCVTVCPCDCFYQDERMLYIDPAECICCEACLPVCPVEATTPAPRKLSRNSWLVAPEAAEVPTSPAPGAEPRT